MCVAMFQRETDAMMIYSMGRLKMYIFHDGREHLFINRTRKKIKVTKEMASIVLKKNHPT
jgi:hypothetical protein